MKNPLNGDVTYRCIHLFINKMKYVVKDLFDTELCHKMSNRWGFMLPYWGEQGEKDAAAYRGRQSRELAVHVYESYRNSLTPFF